MDRNADAATPCRSGSARRCWRWSEPSLVRRARDVAAWTDAHLASHRRSAETIAAIARDALGPRRRVRSARPSPSTRWRQWILERFARARKTLDRSRPERVRRARTRPTRITSRRPSHPRQSVRVTSCSMDLWAAEPARRASTPIRRGWPTSARRRAALRSLDGRSRRARRGH